MAAKADLSFLYGESVAKCTHRIDKHFRDYQTIQYMTGGGVRLGIGGEVFELRGRWFWSGYAGPRIAFGVAEGFGSWAHRYVAFRGPLVSRWTAEGLFPVEAPQRPPGGRDYSRVFDEMLGLSRETGRFAQLRAIHLLEGMLLDLAEARSAAGAPAPEPWVARAMDYLARAAETSDGVDYGALAGSLGMGESTFRRRFRRATGTPPHVYLLQCRVAAARRLLAETDLPIKEIAGRLRYGDVYFFSRQFRKLAGVPPAVYRRSRQG